MLIPAIVPPVTLTRIIPTFNPAHLSIAVRPAPSVPGAMEPRPATLARLGRSSGNAGDRRGEANCNQSFHVNLLCCPRATQPQKHLFHEIPFTISRVLLTG